MQTTIEKERTLNMIMMQPREWTWAQTENERFKEIAKLRDIPEWSVGQYLRNLYELSLPVESNMATSFTDKITDLVSQVGS